MRRQSAQGDCGSRARLLPQSTRRSNPIVVKEFRQAVQSRWWSSVLMLFLLDQPGHRGRLSAAGNRMPTPATRAGGTSSCSCWRSLLITCIGFVPLYTGVRLVAGAQRREHRPVLRHHDHAGSHRPRQVPHGHGPDAADLQRLHAVRDVHLSAAGHRPAHDLLPLGGRISRLRGGQCGRASSPAACRGVGSCAASWAWS